MGFPDVSKKVWHLYVSLYVFEMTLLTLNIVCWVKMALDINPIYAGLERSCPRDSKNVSYDDVGLV